MCRSESCSFQTPSLCPALVLPADAMPLHQLSKPMKPKLPRKLATSARINLNKYWHVLEDLMPIGRRAFDESDSNAINENIDNERRLAAMQLSDVQEGCSRRDPSPMVELFLNGKTSNASSMDDSSALTFSENSTCPKFVTHSPSTSSTTPSECSAFPVFDIPDPIALDENTPPSSVTIQQVSF